LGKTDIHGHVNSIFRRRKRKIERTTTGTEIEMANLPNIYGSNITTGKSSLDKVLPMMARDINVMKSSIVSLAKSQLGQKAKSDAYFAKAQQRENLYESQYGKKSPSASPSKIGSSSKGGGLFDPQTGFFDFLKGIFNQLLKGLAIGGGLFGLKKLLEDPEIRTRVIDTLSSIFLGILGLLKDGAKLFTKMLDKNGPAITKALTETFVAVMGAVEASIRGLTDLLTGPDSKKIYDAIGRVFTAIGDAIVKVFSTKIDIKGIELPLGLVIAGLAALPAILSGFSLAIQRATAAALGFGAGAAVGGASGAIGGIFSMIKKGIGLAIGGAILAYLGATAYNSWKKQNPDLDENGQAIDPKSQSGTLPGLKDPSTGEIDPNKAGVAGAKVGTAVGVAAIAAKLIKSGKGGVPSPSSPTTSPGGYPRGSMVTPTPSVEPPRIATPSSSGGGPRSSTVMGQRNVFPMDGNTAGQRAPLPPQVESMSDKIMKRLKALSSKGKISSFFAYLGKRIAMQYASFKGLAIISAKITGACVALIGAPFTAGASTLLGYGLLAADIYFLYTVVDDFFKENKLDESPTPTSTATQIPSQTTSPTSADGRGDFDFDQYKNLVGQKESGGKGYTADNKVGFLGKYQFGAKALETFGEMKAGSSKKGDMAVYDDSNWKTAGGYKAFLSDPTRQESMMSRYTDAHIKQLTAAGVLSGDMNAADVSSILYAAHHGGVGGAINLFKHGKDTKDKYLSNSSVARSAMWMSQAMGSSLKMNVPIVPVASEASDSPRVNGDLLARSSLSLDDQKRLVIGSGINMINSNNVVNNNPESSKESTPAAQVSSPFDEKMFFESMVKQLFV
jgi:hypothetical protein